MKEIKGEIMDNLKVDDFQNTYCKWSEETQSEVNSLGLQITGFCFQGDYILLGNSVYGITSDKEKIKDLREVELLNGEFYYNNLKERDLKGFKEPKLYQSLLTKDTKKENIEEDTPKNNFKEYGFEADFEGEILKEVKDCYIGWVSYDDTIFSYKWNKKGKGITRLSDGYFNLNIIKKPWYETPNQFKVMMLKEDLGWYPNIFYSEDYLKAGINEMKVIEGKEWRYASKEEIYSLYQEGENNE